MKPRSGSSRCVLVGVSLIAATVAAVRAGEPTPPEAKMPAWVVVKPGPAKPGGPRPIEPTGFVVQVGAVAPKAEIPLELEIRNTSSAPIKILGGNRGCSPRGCVRTTGQYPCVVPPGATIKLAALYTAPDEPAPGAGRSFRYTAEFYVGGITTFAVPFEVTGEVISRPTARPEILKSIH